MFGQLLDIDCVTLECLRNNWSLQTPQYTVYTSHLRGGRRGMSDSPRYNTTCAYMTEIPT